MLGRQLSERKRRAERTQHTFAEVDRLKMQVESVRAALENTGESRVNDGLI